MNEFTAALGLVGTERLDEITAWKNAAAREWLDPGHAGRVTNQQQRAVILGQHVFQEVQRLDV